MRFFLIFPANLLIVAALSAQNAPIRNESNYGFENGGIEGHQSKAERIYTLSQLETLRKAVPPQYVRVLDWNDYGKNKNVLKKGILFTYEGYHLKNVAMAGNFSNWNLIPMTRNENGVYFYILPVSYNQAGEMKKEYVYRYVADGIWTHDTNNKYSEDDGLGGYLSRFYLESADIKKHVTVRTVKQDKKAALKDERLVEFSIYLPEVSNLSLVGDFNDWNPEHDIPVKDENGMFKIRMRLRTGEYLYKYLADGKWILDTYNEETRFNGEIRELCSYIKLD